MENFNKGYSTYILGTSNNASTSLEILLFNKSDWSSTLPKLSLYNLSKVYSQIMSSSDNKKYLILSRETVEDTFKYNYKNGKILGFSVIIYISTVENSPIGYTEFLNVQGIDNNIDINISFSSNISDTIDLELINSLGQLRNNTNTGKDFISQDKLYGYASKDIIIDESSRIDPYPRYTSHVYNLVNNPEMNILLSNGAISGSKGCYRITLNNSINIDPYSNSFENHQLGVYGGDIVLYSWSGNKFSIHSLIKRTRFGNPYVYTTDNIDYNVIDTLGSNRKIFYFSGRFIVAITNDFLNNLSLYDIEKKLWIKPEYDNFFLDTLDSKSIIYSIPNNITSYNITNYLPEINNTFIDLSEFSKYSNIVILEKIGQWYVFKNKRSTIQDYNVYSCINKSLTIVRDKDIPIVLNDSVIMLRTITDDLDYYTVYLDSGIEYVSELARSVNSGVDLEYDEELGIMFCNDDNSDLYRSYYREGKIRVINKKGGIFKTVLEGFRKGYLRDNVDKEVPNIIGAFFGIIYYINEDNYLNYL